MLMLMPAYQCHILFAASYTLMCGLESCLPEFTFTLIPDAVSHWTGSQGGAIYMVNGTSLAVEDSSFTNNTALTGGGIFMSRVADTYIYNNQFYHNNVSQAGGGINSGKHIFSGRKLHKHAVQCMICGGTAVMLQTSMS